MVDVSKTRRRQLLSLSIIWQQKHQSTIHLRGYWLFKHELGLLEGVNVRDLEAQFGVLGRHDESDILFRGSTSQYVSAAVTGYDF